MKRYSISSLVNGLISSWNSPGQNTGVGSHSLLQGIFSTEESNTGLWHCRWILYQLSHQGSLRKVLIVEKFLVEQYNSEVVINRTQMVFFVFLLDSLAL